MTNAASSVNVSLVSGPLAPAMPWTVQGAGAVLAFEGVVRPMEEARSLVALVYEAYEPMTSKELRRLAAAVHHRHALLGLVVEHSVGRVLVSSVSFRLRVAAAHRKPAILAVDEFIDEMKRGVPLWKVPEWTQM